jgi:hypothetical protein
MTNVQIFFSVLTSSYEKNAGFLIDIHGVLHCLLREATHDRRLYPISARVCAITRTVPAESSSFGLV